MDRAVIFVPALDPAHVKWVLLCGEYCSKRGYLVIAIVGVWADTLILVLEKAADIVVTARRDHLPPDRLPRLDVVAEACAEVLSRPYPVAAPGLRPQRGTWEPTQ